MTIPATPAAGEGLPKLQECYAQWLLISDLIFAADITENDINEHDINEHDKDRVMAAFLRTIRWMSEEFGTKFAEAVVELGGQA